MGGRLIWQLPGIETFLVAWKETPGLVPAKLERDLIDTFRRRHGKALHANDPHRLGG